MSGWHVGGDLNRLILSIVTVSSIPYFQICIEGKHHDYTTGAFHIVLYKMITCSQGRNIVCLVLEQEGTLSSPGGILRNTYCICCDSESVELGPYLETFSDSC